MDRGEHDAVTAVVEEGQRPAEVTTHVAEGVVANHREVAQGSAGLGSQRRDLLPQAQDVLGQRVDADPAAYGADAKPAGDRDRQRDGQGHEGHREGGLVGRHASAP